jgi:hypothetical protein
MLAADPSLLNMDLDPFKAVKIKVAIRTQG